MKTAVRQNHCPWLAQCLGREHKKQYFRSSVSSPWHRVLSSWGAWRVQGTQSAYQFFLCRVVVLYIHSICFFSICGVGDYILQFCVFFIVLRLCCKVYIILRQRLEYSSAAKSLTSVGVILAVPPCHYSVEMSANQRQYLPGHISHQVRNKKHCFSAKPIYSVLVFH